MHAIDAVVVAAYVAWSAASGLASARKASESLEEYFLAGRSLSGWSAGLSMAATQFAADTPLVVTGLVATGGVLALWRMWIYAIAFLLLAFVLGASWRRARVLTDAELTEIRYGGRAAAALRGIKAIHFGLVFNCVVLAMVLLATTRIVEPFGRWDLWLDADVFDALRRGVRALGLSLASGGGPCDASCAAECVRARCWDDAAWTTATSNALSLGLVLAVTALYSTTGGLRAVVRTDVVQLAIALGATAAYAWAVIDRVGGLDGLRRGLAVASSDPAALVAVTPLEVDAPLAWMTVVAVQWIAQLNADGSGYLAQRAMACRSDRDARTAGVVFTVTQILVRSVMWLPIVLGLLVLIPPEGAIDVAAREQTFVTGIRLLLPPGVLGLMLAGLLGALASTLDTHLNWGASYVAHDLYGRFFAPRVLGRAAGQRELVLVARLSNVAIVAVALAIVPRLESIQSAWHASLLLGAGVGAVLVLRWTWWRITALSEIAALVTAAVAAPVAMATIESEPVRLVAVAAVATGAAVLIAWLGPAEDPERLRAFALRAHPPGFWGPFAPARSRQRLGWGLAATALGSLAVFAALVALATVVTGAEGPLWIAPTWAWIALQVALAVIATPLALAAARRASP